MMNTKRKEILSETVKGVKQSAKILQFPMPEQEVKIIYKMPPMGCGKVQLMEWDFSRGR